MISCITCKLMWWWSTFWKKLLPCNHTLILFLIINRFDFYTIVVVVVCVYDWMPHWADHILARYKAQVEGLAIPPLGVSSQLLMVIPVSSPAEHPCFEEQEDEEGEDEEELTTIVRNICNNVFVYTTTCTTLTSCSLCKHTPWGLCHYYL